MSRFSGPVIGLLLTAFFTWALHGHAVNAEAGIRHEYTGRRAALKQFVGGIAESLGPIGVLIVGGLIMSLMVVWLVVAIRQRPEGPSQE